MWTDAHCHLDAENVAAGGGLTAVLDRARAAQVERLVAVGVGHNGAALDEVQRIAEADAQIFFTAGIHPHDAKDVTEDEIAKVTAALAHPKCVALGEVGLDYYYDNSPREEQRALFSRMIALAHATDKPLMLHVRSGKDGDAHAEALELLAAAGQAQARPGVVHCFTEGLAIAQRYLALGFYLSIPGIVTFKTAQPLADAVAALPRDRVLVETDSPYLAPIPMRGKKNEPSYIQYTGRKIAALWGASEQDTAATTSANATRLFGL